jgi:RNA polymerase sigma-70 factor (ECF subfamily)
MSSEEPPLNEISTLWSVVRQTQMGPTPQGNAAQALLLERYGKAVHRYLRAAVRDQDAAEELAQEFALRFIRGDLAGVDPQRGRFRDFLKGVLFHLIADYHRQLRQKRPQSLDAINPVAEEPTPPEEAERQFLDSWRDQLMTAAWNGLAQIERQTGQPFHGVLHCRAQHPELRSAQLAEILSEQLDRPITPEGARQLVHRAREKFANLLLDEVAQTLDNPTRDRLEDELGQLGLLEYCRPALDRLKRKA